MYYNWWPEPFQTSFVTTVAKKRCGAASSNKPN